MEPVWALLQDTHPLHLSMVEPEQLIPLLLVARGSEARATAWLRLYVAVLNSLDAATRARIRESVFVPHLGHMAEVLGACLMSSEVAKGYFAQLVRQRVQELGASA